MKSTGKCLGLLMLLAVCLLPVTAGAAESSGTCGRNLTWTLDGSGVLTISGTGAMDDYLYDADAPWYESRESITAAVVERGVTSIGSGAFCKCDHLTTVALPDGLTSVGMAAFSGCSALTAVEVPDTVTELGNSRSGQLKNRPFSMMVRPLGSVAWTRASQP